MSDQLTISFETVAICQLAEGLGLSLREGAGQKSPFRKDRHAGSFSVHRSFFKDHALTEHSGGHIKFVQLTKPNWTKKQCIDFIIRTAGMDPEKQSAGYVKTITLQKRSELYSKQLCKTTEIPSLTIREPSPWSIQVRDRWADGKIPLLKVADKLASSRGWDADVIRKLAEFGKTSLPLLPWATQQDNKRGWGWLVEKPIMDQTTANRPMELVPVGYHTRYKVYPKNAAPEKRWVYTPYVPTTTDPQTAKPRRLSEFQKHLVAHRTRIPAYPFVIGNLDTPKLIVILEGQFDAVSFAVALQWLNQEIPKGITVFGLRGVSSPNVFMAAYGSWLRIHKPFVWLIGDNDNAGKSLVRRKNTERIISDPSFIDRIRAQGCRTKAQFIEIDGCNDFNDIWAKHKPSIEEMHKLASKAGCEKLIGLNHD